MKDYVDCCAQCPNAVLIGDQDHTKWKVRCALDGIKRDYNAFCPHYNKSNEKVEQDVERLMADNIRRCSDCKHFVSLHGGNYIGICTCSSNSFSYLPMTDFPQLFDCTFYHPKTSKVKPRRLCDFCERRIPVLDDYGRYSLECVKAESCPTVNLTTGERTEPDEKTEYDLFIYDENDSCHVGITEIKFCPYCGMKLGGE